MMLRALQPSDAQKAKVLWQQTFHDSDSFLDWFFSNRFTPEWSVGLFNGPELVSIVHGLPMPLAIQNEVLPALMLSGVATVPAYQKQGHMHACIRYLQQLAHEKGIDALFNCPQNPGTYDSLGFRPFTAYKRWQGTGEGVPGIIAPFDEEAAFGVYAGLLDRYTGFALRSRDEFRRKMADYACDGGQGCMLMEQGRAIGYAIYYMGERLQAVEVLSLGTYAPLLHHLQQLCKGHAIEAKLPPDVPVKGETVPQNVLLASPEVWQKIHNSKQPCFCVDEY